MKKEMPIIVDLKQGTYYWCSCGKTKHSHSVTGHIKGQTMCLWNSLLARERKLHCSTAKKPGKRPIVTVHIKNLRINISSTRRQL